jgi:hypothetical protein
MGTLDDTKADMIDLRNYLETAPIPRRFRTAMVAIPMSVLTLIDNAKASSLKLTGDDAAV